VYRNAEIKVGNIITGFVGRFLAAAAVAALAASVQAAEPSMTKSQYEEVKAHADVTYKAAKERCDSLAGNAKDICVAEAKANLKRAEGKATAQYKNTHKAWYEMQVENAEADYLVAKEICDDLAGNEKDVCVKKAKATRTQAIADAKAQRKTAEAQNEAREEAGEAREDAAEDKRDAEYKVQLQRCDEFSGQAKDECVARAKRAFGKS
jgi:hypothetical protein